MARAKIFVVLYCVVVLYQDCSNYAPGVKIGHALGVVWFYIGIYRENVNNCFKRHLLLNRLANFDETSQGCSLGGALSKLLKEMNSMQNSGCHGNRKEKLQKSS